MAEKKIIELEVKTNTPSLKAQLREAQNEVNALSEKFGATSKEAVNAAKKAAELKDAIGDAKALTDAFNPDAKFNALSASIGGVVNGFEAFQGALGLVGVEGEAVQATLLKVQSAMALSQGLQGLGEAKDSFKQLGAVASNALKGIKTGIAATGIGLFVVALGLVVAYWDDIKAAVSGVSEKQKKLNANSQANLDIQKAKLTAIDSQENILKLQGKSEKDILNLKIAQTNEVINATKKQLLNNEKTAVAQIEASKRNKEILSGILQFISLPLSLILRTIDDAGKLIGKDFNLNEKLYGGLSKFAFDPKDTKKEIAAVKAETIKGLNELRDTKAGYFLEIKKLDEEASKAQTTIDDKAKTAAEKAKAAADKLLEEQLKAKQLQIEETNDEMQLVEDAQNNYYLKQKTQKQQELDDTNNKYFKLIELAKKYGQDTSDLLKAQKQEENEIIYKYDAELRAYKTAQAEITANEMQLVEDAQNNYYLSQKTKNKQELDDVSNKYFNLIELAKKNGQDTTALLLAQAEEEKKIKENAQLLIIDTAKNGFISLGNLAMSFAGKSEAQQKKAFELQKAANIAGAIIDVIRSTIGAFKSGNEIAGPALGFAQAGIAAAGGAVMIRNLEQQTFNGRSNINAPNNSSGNNSQVVTPNFNIIGNQNQSQLSQLNQAPIKAYVVGSDVTTQQMLDKKKIQNATI